MPFLCRVSSAHFTQCTVHSAFLHSFAVHKVMTFLGLHARDIGASPNQLSREFPFCRVKRAGMQSISHSFSPDLKADESRNIDSRPVGLALVPGDVALLRLQWNHQLEGPGRVPDHVQGETILLCQQGPVRGCQEGNIIQSILVLPGLRELQYGWLRVLQSEGG